MKNRDDVMSVFLIPFPIHPQVHFPFDGSLVSIGPFHWMTK